MEENRKAEAFRQLSRQNRLKEAFEQTKDSSKPKVETLNRLAKAFCVGGGICMFAQLFRDWLQGYGVSEGDASAYCTILLILITGILTATGIFDKIGRFAGAGTYVPISGFANSIVSSAIEFRTEGMVFGVGAMMFKVAGPVIVYGVVSSWLAGFVYFLSTLARR
ncbi:MAG: SpoVA/SpoVAEb family sporulation membrane protein [Eubacteriaceae bacterium]|jgi:stage V sporulation protein AC|nr:SpoVA/SpoVAEb family sporulation membrane protein [Eubacteriaceae bacterium]